VCRFRKFANVRFQLIDLSRLAVDDVGAVWRQNNVATQQWLVNAMIEQGIASPCG
jgi:hypothetical protein